MDLSKLPNDIQIFGNLCQISNMLDTIGNDFLKDLTTKQWFFLACLSNLTDNPPTINEMACLMGSSHQNVKQIALKLEKKGFIEITKDEKDARSLRLLFTKKAMEYGNAFENKGAMFLSLLYKDFNNEDKNNFTVLTNKMLNTLKDMQETKNYMDISSR